jgi:hypothetical protein
VAVQVQVGDEQRRRPGGPERDHLVQVRVEHQDPHQHAHDQHQGQRREEPSGSPGVEGGERDGAPTLEFAGQQLPHDEARHHEEDVDADEATRQRHARVAHHHDGDGDGA